MNRQRCERPENEPRTDEDLAEFLTYCAEKNEDAWDILEDHRIFQRAAWRLRALSAEVSALTEAIKRLTP